MFLLSILLLYTLPTIYTYIRLKKLVPRGLYRILFTLFYLFLAFGFFIAEILSHRITNGNWIKYLILIGYYTLPFLFYLFLSVLLFDILRGANHLLKIVPIKATENYKFRSAVIWILFIIPTIIVFIGTIHVNNIRINKYNIDIPRKSSVINHLKIAMAADFHLGQITDKKFLGEFADRLNSLNPDIVLLPGDIVEGHRDENEIKQFTSQFRQINSKYGVYASPGNHESHNINSKLQFFSDAGIKLLTDEFVCIANSFYLLGRNDGHSNNRKPIEEFLKQMPNQLPVIVLDHRPTDIEAATRSGVDIQLSGHTHNGQLFPLNFIVSRIYELAWKYKKIKNTHLFVTSGIQVWGPPVRTAGDSEIMVIEVDFKNNLN